MATTRRRPARGKSNAFQVDFRDETGKRHRRDFRTKKEADAFRIDIEKELKTGNFRSEALRMNVKDLSIRFIEYCRVRHKRRERMTRATLVGYESLIRNYILAEGTRVNFSKGLGEIKLSSFNKPSRVIEFRDDLRAGDVSVAMTRAVLRCLHVMLEYGRTRDLIASNPAHGIKVVGRRDEGSRKVVPPPKAVVGALLAHAEPRLNLMVRVDVGTALRIGELRALRYGDFDFEKNTVRVERRFDAWNDDDDDGTKSPAGMRTIPISGALGAAVQHWRSQAAFDGDEDLVFSTGRGTPYGYNRCADMLEQFFAEHPEVVRCTWHEFRHFAISCWIEADMKPKTVQTFAGHKSLQTTMDRYGHLFPSDEHQAAMDLIAASLIKEEQAQAGHGGGHQLGTK